MSVHQDRKYLLQQDRSRTHVMTSDDGPSCLEGCTGKKQGCRLGEKRRVHDRYGTYEQRAFLY